MSNTVRMIPELVIFDCDGVLVDSEPLGVDVDLAVLAELGIAMTRSEVIDRFVGRSPEALVTVIEGHLGASLPTDWIAGYRDRRRQAFDAELTVVDGIVQALDQIAVTSCVASSSMRDSLDYKLRLTGLHDRFAGRIFSRDDVSHGKPAPDLFLFAAERLGVPPSRCVVVEDSVAGVAAARSAGMYVLAYAGGVTPATQLGGPDTTIFHSMTELPRLVTPA